MSETQLNAIIFKCLACVLCVLTLSVTSCNIHQTQTLKAMTENGSDPLRASCAIDRGNQLCLIIAGAKP